MAVMKVIEVMANSDKSWEDATKKAVAHASKSIKHKCKNKHNVIRLNSSKTDYKSKVVAFTSFKGGVGVSTLTTLFCIPMPC